MAMNVFTLLGQIAIDASGAEKTLSITTTKAEKYSQRMQNAFRTIGKVATTVFTLDVVKRFGQACVNSYADIAATEAAFTQTMGNYTDQATAKLKGLEAQTGVASSRMMNHFTMLTSRYLKHGYSMEEATDFAAQGLLVAADAAAFYNKSLDDSMGNLSSFINGSYEGGEAIGLFARESEMAQKAMEQGFITDPKQWASLDEATRQVVRLDEATRQMAEGKITGQSLLESGSLQNQLANMQAMVSETETVLGKPLTEDAVLPGIGKLQELMQLVIDNKEAISTAISPFAEFLGGLATNGLDMVKGALEWVVTNKDRLETTLDMIGGCFFTIAMWTHPVATSLSLIVSKWDEITEAVDSAIIAVERFFGINNGSGVEQGSSGAYHGSGGGNFESNAPVSTENAYTGSSSQEFWGIKGYATGLDRVPFDNYVVRLHKDEAVLNATNAEAWRKGGTKNLEAKMDNMINLLQQLISNTGKNHTIQLDNGLLVGQLLPAIDSGLGTIASRKSRRV